MNIIKRIPESNGEYSPIQTVPFDVVPAGWLRIADDCNEAPFYDAHGFVTLTIVDGVITAFTPDMAAWEAWKAAHPETPAEPDATAQTQIALAELAETESAHDVENKLALAELAEMIGGTSNG